MYLLMVAALALAGPPTEGWETLLDDDVLIRCSQAGPQPWCRASGDIHASADQVYALLDDIDGHTRIFERIAVSVEYAPGYAHQVVRLPFPLESRDYLVHLTRVMDGADHVIRFDSISSAQVPAQGVRLDHFAGEFRVHPLGPDRVRFSYLWEAELGADVPSFALPVAWQAQGSELVRGLRAAAEGQGG